MKKAAIGVVLVIVLAAGWFFVSPLFIDEAVDESFDFVTADGRVDLDKVMAMPEEKRMGMKDEIMATAAAVPDQAEDEAMPDAPQVVAQGNFIDADAVHKGSGTATLYALPDGRNVVRFEDFRTTNGPALVVYLAKHPSPTSAADVLDDGFVDLGKLKGNVGNQNYEIPADVDVSEYGSVVIWCVLFDVLFSPAALERA
ncbi:MAG: DM13 domain-containing protein [Woeseiaceae bacterium]|nr:DM13 domain-containing protein [Woeseiaceae bacterium]